MTLGAGERERRRGGEPSPKTLDVRWRGRHAPSFLSHPLLPPIAHAHRATSRHTTTSATPALPLLCVRRTVGPDVLRTWFGRVATSDSLEAPILEIPGNHVAQEEKARTQFRWRALRTPILVASGNQTAGNPILSYDSATPDPRSPPIARIVSLRILNCRGIRLYTCLGAKAMRGRND